MCVRVVGVEGEENELRQTVLKWHSELGVTVGIGHARLSDLSKLYPI